jgi:hypothetical protein
MSPTTSGKKMATDTKKTKTDIAPKSDTAPKVKDTPVKEASTPEAAKEASTPKSGEKTGGEKTGGEKTGGEKTGGEKTGGEKTGGETTGAAPANYSRGEGQKPVTAAYKENWNVIFGKKKKSKKNVAKKKR